MANYTQWFSVISFAICSLSSRRHKLKGAVSRTRFKKNKKHLKNVGPIRHSEPPHANSPDVASGTVTRRLRIDVHNDDNDNA